MKNKEKNMGGRFGRPLYIYAEKIGKKGLQSLEKYDKIATLWHDSCET